MPTTTADCPIKFTETALKEVRQLIYEKELAENYALRVGVKGGGCAGMSYILGFDEIKDGDKLYQIDDLQILMNPSHGMYLLGMEIDYHNDLNNRGFIFNNPNANDTCGCGTSFS